MIATHYGNGAHADEALIFRTRSGGEHGWRKAARSLGGPLADHYNVGRYHSSAVDAQAAASMSYAYDGGLVAGTRGPGRCR